MTRELNEKAHSLAVARDLASKYVRESFAIEKKIADELDNGTYDLEDYVMEVAETYIALIPKETT